MGVDAEGKANVNHRPRKRTPQMRCPPLLGRGRPRLYRGGLGEKPPHISLQPKWGPGKGRASGGANQEAAERERRRRFAAAPC